MYFFFIYIGFRKKVEQVEHSSGRPMNTGKTLFRFSNESGTGFCWVARGGR